MPIMNAATDKRSFSQEGFMLADAVIGQVGDLPYTRGELGFEGNPNEIITLRRSKQVLEQALPTMVGAPITIGHPPKFVGTGDAKSKAVGAVVSTPVIDNEGKVKATIRLFDDEAIDLVKGGTDQLSPGFNFVPTNLTDTGGDISEMSVNHVAIVPRGRAGSTVRILDQLPPNIGIDMEKFIMTDETKIVEAVRRAVDEAMSKSARPNMSDTDVSRAITDSISASLKPVVDDIAAIKEKQAKDEAAAEAKKAEDAANAERDKIIDEVTKAERKRYAILQDALPFIPEDKQEGLDEASLKEILKLAVGDAVANPDEASDDVLYGVFLGKKSVADQQQYQQANDEGMVFRKPKGEKKAKDVYKSIYRKSRGMKEED